MIVNALYLLVGWIEPFTAAATSEEPFHCPSGTRPVPMMRGSREARHAHDGWEYLVLPLHLGFQAEILLPPSGADAHLDGLDATALGELRGRATGHRVNLHLPRFRVSWATGLLAPLQALGIGHIFDRAALGGVVVEEQLNVSGAFHAAVLRVDESGVEGAAATAVVGRAVAFRQLPEIEVRVDRPFFFLVTHRDTAAVLFLAYVTEP